MVIADTVNKWFDETLGSIRDHVPPAHPVDRFFPGVLLVSKKYVDACFLLVEHDHKMPAKALLRVLAEFCIKLTWCLDIHQRSNDERRQVVSENRMKWWRRTVLQRIKELKKWKEVSDPKLRQEVESALSELQLLEDGSEMSAGAPMPATLPELLKGLPPEYGKDAYPKLYIKYNDAIHIDEATLGLLVHALDGKVVVWNADSTEDSDELRNIAVYYALMINDWVRQYYGWDSSEMRAQGDEILGLDPPNAPSSTSSTSNQATTKDPNGNDGQQRATIEGQ